LLIKSTDTNAEDDQSNRQGISFSTSEENIKPSKLMLRKTYKRKMGEFDSHTHRKMEDTNDHINPNDDLNSSSNAGTTDHPDDTAKRTVNTTPYQCEKCNVYFCDKSALNRHMNQKNPCVKVGVFKYASCAKCSYKTNLLNNYQRHMNRKTDCSGIQSVLQCQQWNQVFQKQSKLDNHEAKCLGIPGMKKCKDCGSIKPQPDFRAGGSRCNKCYYEKQMCSWKGTRQMS
jgi:hypothetical protein